MKKARGPSEAQIQSACDDLMVLDGWRIVKTDLPHLRGLGVQERGMPDRLYLRYGLYPLAPIAKHEASPLARLICQSIWIEWKKRGGKASEYQKTWHAIEGACGALVVVAGVDFPASVDGFLDWYNGSGFSRRRLTLGNKS